MINHARPHSSLEGRTPKEEAELLLGEPLMNETLTGTST